VAGCFSYSSAPEILVEAVDETKQNKQTKKFKAKPF
jgi:hypothetical protein